MSCECFARMEGECICGAWTNSRKKEEQKALNQARAEGFQAGIEAAAAYHQRKADNLRKDPSMVRENYFEIAAHLKHATRIRALKDNGSA